MTHQYRFGNYLYHEHLGLHCGNRPLHLPPKERGLLLALLQAGGQVVHKDTLVAAIWNKNSASDESISRTVYRLRTAMQKNGGSDVIETIYNSGFRITVPVHTGHSQESSGNTGLAGSVRPPANAALGSAREYLARRSPEDIEAAASAARVAINSDPTFAAAWSTLAEVRLSQVTRSLRPPREAGWLAKEAAQSALRLDPSCASALAIQGWVVALVERDVPGGLADLDRALELDPDSWMVALLRGWALQAAGRPADAVSMLRQAQLLNPVSHTVNALPAMFLMLAGEQDEALPAARNLAHRFSTIDEAQSVACVVCSVSGLHAEAIGFGRRAVALAPHTPALHTALAYALAHAGEQAAARALLSEIQQASPPEPSAATAPVYLALGERQTAIGKLQDAKERGIPQFAWARNDPRLSSLCDEPAVQALWQ